MTASSASLKSVAAPINSLSSLNIKAVNSFLDQVAEEIIGESPRSVLFVPPDLSRVGSEAGYLTAYLYQKLPLTIRKGVLPATGLHRPMDEGERITMFGRSAEQMDFINHDAGPAGDNHVWGKIISGETKILFGENGEGWSDLWEEIEVVSNRNLLDFDLIVSIGQVLPHEITGMANYHKNILIGIGGEDFISKSHFIGAAIGIPQLVGKADNPMRDFLKTVYDRHIRPHLNIKYIFSVTGDHSAPKISFDEEYSDLSIPTRLSGLFYGNDDTVFHEACRLSQEKNISQVSPICDRVWVHMPALKYRSLWLANKAIYRTRSIIRKGGELIIDAPGVTDLGENPAMNEIIARFGYRAPETILDILRQELSGEREPCLSDHLAVAAHLIHGYQDNHQVLFVDHGKSGGLASDEFHRVGFGSIPVEEYREEIKRSFSNHGLDPSAYPHWELSQVRGDRHDCFINDAGMGFWTLKHEK